jgi:hypothetical protein
MYLFEDSILVAAHPDDEILWFSSILGRVNGVVICFLEKPSNPLLGIGRREALSKHPCRYISSLNLDEAGVFSSTNWTDPVATPYGLKIRTGSPLAPKYRENFQLLMERLPKRLEGCRNVFSHNPWGEYGNEEHVQLYRALKKLQKGMGFHLWYSNYASNMSLRLMMQQVSGFDSDYVTLPTDKELGQSLKSLYIKHGCWTWYEGWEWFNEESFMEDRDVKEAKEGHIFPLNMLKFHTRTLPERRSKRVFRLIREMGAVLRGDSLPASERCR